MKSTTASTPFKRRSLGALAVCVFAVIVSASVASAQVTVNSLSLPTSNYPEGEPIPGGITGTVGTGDSCQSFTAENQTAPGEPVNYELLFWDNQGTIVWPTSGTSTSVVVCPGSTPTLATAWYVLTGGGTCKPVGSPQCYSVSTFAFSIDKNEFLVKGTPIASVSPNSPVVWSPPSTSVITYYGNESITANSTETFPGNSSAEPFRYWQQLLTTTVTPIGEVYVASRYSEAWVVAFYGPDPCVPEEEALANCEAGQCQHGPCNCSGQAKILQLCKYDNRESTVP